jgi:flagellar hook assembly protein FlgD
MQKWILVFIGVGLCSLCAHAQSALPWTVIGSGGTISAQGSQRVLSATVGQAIIGRSAITSGNSISQGFWLPLNTTTNIDDEATTGGEGSVVSNYPNPFSSSTTIRFQTPIEGPVTVRIFNLVGNLVRTISAELSAAGQQDILFDGRSDDGSPLAAGTYLYDVSLKSSITQDATRTVQRMSIVR